MARKRKGRRARWLMAVGVLVMVLMIAGVAWQNRRPWELWLQEREKAVALRSDLAEIREENRALEARRKELGTPAGIEAEARRQGWVKKGEQILSLPPDPPDKDH